MAINLRGRSDVLIIIACVMRNAGGLSQEVMRDLSHACLYLV